MNNTDYVTKQSYPHHTYIHVEHAMCSRAVCGWRIKISIIVCISSVLFYSVPMETGKIIPEPKKFNKRCEIIKILLLLV